MWSPSLGLSWRPCPYRYSPRRPIGGATLSRCSVRGVKIPRGAGASCSCVPSLRKRCLRKCLQTTAVRLYQEINHAVVPPGLIAYADGRPVGWTRVGPRHGFPGVRENRSLAKVLSGDDPGVWWVTCFAVDRQYRRSGIGAALLQSAVAFARDHGATAVEGHPVDAAGLTAARVAGSALYTGTMAMFIAAGFVEVCRTYPTRPVMRLSL